MEHITPIDHQQNDVEVRHNREVADAIIESTVVSLDAIARRIEVLCAQPTRESLEEAERLLSDIATTADQHGLLPYVDETEELR